MLFLDIGLEIFSNVISSADFMIFLLNHIPEICLMVLKVLICKIFRKKKYKRKL